MSLLFGRLGAPGIEGALLRYRVMSWIVGVMLLVLCVVALPLQYVANRPAFADAGFPVHGVLYILYLLTVADLVRRAHLPLRQLVGLVCAGFLPGLAFYVEHRTTKRLLAEGLINLSE